MRLFNRAVQKLEALKRKRVDVSSLQFRLTLGITAVSLLGMGGIGAWTMWDMRQMLVVKHKERIQTVASTLSHTIGTVQSSSLPRLQNLMDQESATDLWVWVKRSDGTMLAHSRRLPHPIPETTLTSMSHPAQDAEVYDRDGQYWVMCSRTLQIDDRSAGPITGQLYVAQDITHDFTVLTTLLRSLVGATLLVITVFVVCIAILIGRSLRPLRQMNQLAIVQDGAQWDTDQMPLEIRELAQAFNTLSLRLSEAGEQQRQFTSSMSHELRTSLSLIYGYLQSTLRRCQNLTDPQKEALQVATSETERTIQLLKDLLDLARIQNGSLELHPEALILNDILPIVVDTATQQPDSPVVKLELPAAPIAVSADRQHLIQAVLRLVDNAKRYGAQGEPIVVQLSQTQAWATIQVCDRGCGIPLAEQQRIFEPFYRVEDSRCRTTGGVGLGLAFVKSLLTSMGGQILVQSAPGEGSTFTVKLPLVENRHEVQRSEV